MALLTYQQISVAGTAQTFGAAAGGGDTVAPDDRGFVEIVNGGGAGITATLVVPGAQYGQNRPDVAVAIGAGARAKIGPLVPDLADPTTGLVSITYSGVTSVTVAAIRV